MYVTLKLQQKAALKRTNPGMERRSTNEQWNDYLAEKQFPDAVENAKPLAFKNMGNTCYLDAVLTMLMYCSPVQRLAQFYQDNCNVPKAASAFASLLSATVLNQSSTPAFASSKVFRQFSWGKQHAWGEQHDAQEFQTWFLDEMSDGCPLILNKGHSSDSTVGLSYVQHAFGGWLESYVECCVCWNRSPQRDFFMDLSLELDEQESATSSSTVQSLLNRFMQPEQFDPDNLPHCELCNENVAACKGLDVVGVGQFLCINLKRFKYHKKEKREVKRNLKVRNSLSLTSNGQAYQLVGVVQHHGRYNDAGHYTCYRKLNNSWHHFDDLKQKVEVVDAQDVEHAEGYLALYEVLKPTILN